LLLLVGQLNYGKQGKRMAPDYRPAHSTLAAEHAALQAAFDALQDRLVRESRAGETTAAELALLRANHSKLEARYAALSRELAEIGKGWRIDRSLRRLLSRHPSLVARLYRFIVRHPGMHRLLRPAARLVRWTVPDRNAAGLTRSPTSEPSATSPTPTPPPPAAEAIENPRIQLRAILPTTTRSPTSEPSATSPTPTPPPPAAKAIENPRIQLRAILPTTTPPSRHGSRRMVCVTHVLPHPPRAGNQYRISRVLAWLSRQGWEVLLVVCPPADEELAEDHVRQTAAASPDLIICRHDGILLHHLPSDGAMLEKLNGRCPRSFASVLGEDATGDNEARRTLDILRTFCPDVLVELLLHLEAHFDPEVLLAEYVFMTRAFPLFRPKLRKVIDTIDVFSTKRRKVEDFGIADGLTLADSEEASLLNRADLLIAIQPDEAAELRRLAPPLPVITVGVDFDVADHVAAPTNVPVILLVASDNQMNHKGLKDFLRFAWPLVRREVADAELRIVGPVGDTAEVSSPGIRIVGCVDDVRAAYAQARVVINPAVAGTGLKIKTVEALCHFRPIVLWPCGVEGIALEAPGMCHVASDWFNFAHLVIRLARRQDDGHDFLQRRQELIRHFAPDRVYAPLAQALNTH
jgi:hypothetical protein